MNENKPPTPPKGDYVKVTNAHTAALGLPPLTAERAKQIGVDIKGEYGDRSLIPGENHVPVEYWNAIKARSPVSNWLEEGMLYEGADKATGKRDRSHSAKASLANATDAEALEYVGASTDRDQLQQWLASEKRPAIRDAINRRFESLPAVK